MPKHVIEHQAGKVLDPQVDHLVRRFFDEAQLEKLRTKGGRLTIAIAIAKGTRRKKIGKPEIRIDDSFLEQIKAASESEEEISSLLANLAGNQLREVGKLLNLSFPSKARLAEMRSEIIRLFQHQNIWNRISRIENPT